MEILYIFIILVILSLLYLYRLRLKKVKKYTNIDKKKNTKSNSINSGEIQTTPLLMTYEQAYYYRIIKLIPSNTILHTQVSFSAFLTSPEISIRNQFNRSHADLVVTDRKFNVLLIIEVDGSSHKCYRVQERDKKRDKITSSAGIPTLRIDDSFSDQKISKMIRKLSK